MRAVVQRVSQASVIVLGDRVGAIDRGLLVFLGVTHNDTESDAEYIADKTTNLRVFEDKEGKMNRSLIEVGGGILAVSQFTLYGDCRKGRRPSFDQAARPEHARRLYEYYVAQIRKAPISVATGVFQAEMQVTLTNDGPVTLIVDSKKI
jgi:D-tyrosyl-tRNA(Tyr) deacylase